MCKRAILLITCFFLLVAWFDSGGNAQEAEPDTRAELWPEVDLFVPLNEKVRLFFLVSVSKARETRDNLEGQVGVMLITK